MSEIKAMLTCTIENSGILLGMFEGDQLVFEASLSADRSRSADEYAILIGSCFAMHGRDPAEIGGAVVASVVRPLSAAVMQAIERMTGVRPLLVGPGIKTGLNIKTDIPSQVGADIVANAVAALSMARGAMVIVDFGTATTLTGINGQGELCGVMIAPGLQTSLDALSANAAELPFVSLDRPAALLGKNTNDAMASGFIHGHAAMVDGLLARVAADWMVDDLTVIATGRLAGLVIPNCLVKFQIREEPDLALIGLKLIFRLNERRRP